MTDLKSTIVEFDLTNHKFKNLSLDDFSIDRNDTNKVYWIHADLNDRSHFDTLAKKIHLSDDVIKLCDETDIVPRLIDRDESLTLQIQCLLSTNFDEYNEVAFRNLTIHLTDRFCFTASYETVPALLEFMDNYQKSTRYAKTPCFILFLIFDNSVNDYSQMLFNFEIITDTLETNIQLSNKNIYNEVMEIKRQVMKVKRYTIAAREILMRISGRNISVISEQCRTSLYNLSNHTHMAVHEADSIRDMLNNLLDQIENAMMQRMSETIRILTVFASIFLPLTLITGIYGMNFVWIPELHWKYGYFYAISLLFICAAVLLFVFKKMKWF